MTVTVDLGEGTTLDVPLGANRRIALLRESVLRWYAEASGGPFVPPPAGDGDLVVAVPGAAGPAGRLAAALGRPLVVLPDVAAATAMVARDLPSSMLLVAEAAALPWSVLSPLHEAATAVSWGVLPYDGLDQLAFWCAKVLLAQRSARGSYGAFDALTRTAARGAEEVAFDLATARALFWEGWRHLSLVSHGDGQHLNIGVGVLCGLIRDAEHVDGVPVAGCSGPGRTCRRSRGDVDVVLATSLRAEVLSLLSCTSFCTTGDTYPSDISLLSTVADAYPAAVVTSPVRLRFTFDCATVHGGELRAGLPLGEVTARRSATVTAYDDTPWLTLVGDPLWRPYAPDPLSEPLPAPEPATVRVTPEPQPDAVLLHHRMHAYESAVRLTPPPEAALPHLERMTALRLELERMLYGDRLGVVPEAEVRPYAGRLAGAWDLAAAETFATTSRDAPGSADGWPKLFHAPRPRVDPGTCERCHGPLHARTWTSGLVLPPRRTLDCPVCGPRVDDEPGVLTLALPVLPVHLPGDAVEVSLRASVGGSGDGRVTLALVLGDVVNTVRWSSGARPVSLREGGAGLTVPVPESYLSGLPEVRAAAFYAGHVAYAYTRLPLAIPRAAGS